MFRILLFLRIVTFQSQVHKIEIIILIVFTTTVWQGMRYDDTVASDTAAAVWLLDFVFFFGENE